MKKLYLIYGILSLILILGISLSYAFLHQEKSNVSNVTGKVVFTPSAPVSITYSNIESELSKNTVVNALPKDSKVLIKFYHYEGDNRVIEKVYSLSKGSVKEGTIESPDLILYLDSSYLSELTTQNFCSVIQKAKTNGHLGIEMVASSISVAWKYSGMLKYKDCFGY